MEDLVRTKTAVDTRQEIMDVIDAMVGMLLIALIVYLVAVILYIIK